ncbi:expansin A9 [Actinidia rufa]|uniref:Expansin A9 n=1 Tax=Actinidia rufa TaxID=165716 RepID=A0A7J0GJJ9_9ERIC|nr:expansin A9 [Actinidia rufa]GFZ10987.1 expansin A9 [Actinidia rufa]
MRRDVPGGGGAVVAGSDAEGEGLAHEDGVGLPVLAPVAAHGHPLGVGSFHAHAHDVPCTRDVGDKNQVEVTEAVDRESDPALLSARHPVKSAWNGGRRVPDFRDSNPDFPGKLNLQYYP